MGSGYNTSLAAGRAARNRASTRTPVHFWLDVPYYVYELPCQDTLTGEHHTFRSRTPATSMDGMYHFWCERCREYRSVRALTHQPDRPHSADELTGWEQDKGTVRERIGRELQARGFLDTDEAIAKMAAHNWSLEPGHEIFVTVAEIKKINAALVAPEGLSPELPEVCRAGLHEMTADNIEPTSKGSDGSRRCRACYLEARKKAQAAYRDRRKAQAQDQQQASKAA